MNKQHVTTTINWPEWPRYGCNRLRSVYGCGSRASARHAETVAGQITPTSLKAPI
jgi:hypothetical protein